MTATDRLFQAITEDIVECKLKPEQKLSEPEIAKKFGTSRAPIREALRRMEERGLVIHRPHQGYSVAAFSIEKLIEIFEVREALEGIACRLACERMSNKDIAKLKDIVRVHKQELNRNPNGGYSYQYQDIDFHFLIVKGSKNSMINKLICEDNYNMMLIYRNLHKEIAGSGKQALKEHFRVLDALENRDGELAEILMRRHIIAAKSRAIQSYKRLHDKEE